MQDIEHMSYAMVCRCIPQVHFAGLSFSLVEVRLDFAPRIQSPTLQKEAVTARLDMTDPTGAKQIQTECLLDVTTAKGNEYSPDDCQAYVSFLRISTVGTRTWTDLRSMFLFVLSNPSPTINEKQRT